MPINFYFERKITLKNRKGLKLFIASIFEGEAKALMSLEYIFCSDEYLLNINKLYLDHDYYTDIISFDLRDSPKSPSKGEIYISIDRVRENADNYTVPVEQELHRVIFHGALHLCGYTDKTKAQQKKMRSKEDFYLAQYEMSV